MLRFAFPRRGTLPSINLQQRSPHCRGLLKDESDKLVTTGFSCETVPKTINLLQELYSIPGFCYDTCQDRSFKDYETAQVAASGMIYDQTFHAAIYPTALDVATVTKLVRNIMIANIIPAMTFIYSWREDVIQANPTSNFRKAWKLFPIFIIGFLLMAILRSIGDTDIRVNGTAFGLWDGANWMVIYNSIKEWSGYILATAMAGVGLSTSFKTMKGLGIKPFYVGFFAAVMVGVVALIMVFVLGRFVDI